MALKIYWTDFSKQELQRIFSFYQENASSVVARKIVIGIENVTTILKTHPNTGQREELLKDRLQDFRYFILKNYKIINWNNTQKNRIEIAGVFDTRQNPIKILNHK